MNGSGSDDRGTDVELSFGRRLRRTRMRKGWSQLQLANRMGETAKHHEGTAQLPSLIVMISKWENGAKVPGEYNRRLLAETLGVSVADLGLTADPDFLW